MTLQHASQAEGKWQTLTLYEQMGNIGTEIGRMRRAENRNNEEAMQNATDRALELLDLTIADPRRTNQLKEIARAREVLLDALSEKPEYGSNLADIDKYFMQFAIAARLNR